MHCITHARVSTDKQAERELSIPAQLQAMRQYAHQRNWSIIEEVVESGQSARTADRPGLRRLLSQCRDKHSQVDVVLVHKIDRLARNLADHVAIRGVLKEGGVALASVVENLDESISGQLVENIMASLAQFYSANLAEEVKKGLQQKVRQGGWPHLAPIGYRSMDRTVAVDPLAAPIVRQAFERYARGDITLTALAASLREPNLSMSVSTLQRVLRNPFYIGRLRWKGTTYPGRHQPLISDDLFDRVQQLLNERRRRLETSPRHNLLLRGFARCGTCAEPMVVDGHARFNYYRCRQATAVRNRCPARYTNAVRADGDVRELYSRIPLAPVIRRWLLSRLQAQVRQRSETQRRDVEAVHRRLRETDKRAVDLATQLSTGLMEPDVYGLVAQELKHERARLRARLATLTAAPPASAPHLGSVRTVRQLHDRLPLEEQQILLRFVFSDLSLRPEGLASFQLRPPFDVLDDQEQSRAA